VVSSLLPISFDQHAQSSKPGCNKNNSVLQQQTSLPAKNYSVVSSLLQTQGAYEA